MNCYAGIHHTRRGRQSFRKTPQVAFPAKRVVPGDRTPVGGKRRGLATKMKVWESEMLGQL